MAKSKEKDNFPCPGHKGECEFCKNEYGNARSTGWGIQTDRQGNPVVDYCCHYCKTNHKTEAGRWQGRTSLR